MPQAGANKGEHGAARNNLDGWGTESGRCTLARERKESTNEEPGGWGLREPERAAKPAGVHLSTTALCSSRRSPEATRKSHPNCATSTGMWGTDWHASSKTSAPTCLAAATTSDTGATQPNTLETWAMETSLVLPGTRRDCRWATSSCSVLLRRAKRTMIPEGGGKGAGVGERGRKWWAGGRAAAPGCRGG
eukprot:scaffold8791_cov98-Isochrysis_galbana.AAC.1